MIRKFAVLAVVGTLCSPVLAEDNAPPLKEVEALRQQGYSVKTITPIFSQLVTFSFPKGFVPAFEDAQGGQYIHESVLEGESVKKWSQMVTITGAKDLASNPNVTRRGSLAEWRAVSNVRVQTRTPPPGLVKSSLAAMTVLSPSSVAGSQIRSAILIANRCS